MGRSQRSPETTNQRPTLADVRKKIGYIPESSPDDEVPPGKRGRQYAKFYIDIGRQGHKIGGSGALVYNALLSHAFGTRLVWPSQQRLCELTGLKLTAVKIALKRLRDVGVLMPGPKRGKVNTYILR